MTTDEERKTEERKTKKKEAKKKKHFTKATKNLHCNTLTRKKRSVTSIWKACLFQLGAMTEDLKH